MPYSAHNSSSGISTVLMNSMLTSMRHFSPLDPPNMFEFNNVLQRSIPKKVTHPFERGVACRTLDTRSLSCKCIDNKVICKAMSYAMMPIVERVACSIQDGFIKGRYHTNNIPTVDTISRIYSHCCHKYGNAVAAFFDFANTFPSVALAWIFLVLKWLRVPEGIICFVRALYHNVCLYLKHAGQTMFMCIVRSGVLQGCPLASLLFVLALEPFLCMFQRTIINCDRGIVCACADDLACVLKNWVDLLGMYIYIYSFTKQRSLLD